MKKIVKCAAIGLLLFSVSNLKAQDDKSKRVSPPAAAKGKIGAVTVTIDYSQPSVNDRVVWGDLVPYGEVWRTGANEATTITVSDDVLIEGQLLHGGKYSLFTIPGKDHWVIIFNKEPKQWGAYKYDQEKDALRVDVKPMKSDKMTEKLTFEVNKSDKGGEVKLSWEKLAVKFVVSERK